MSELKKLQVCPYRPPVSVEVIPDEKMRPLEEAIQRHLDYNEARRAAGRVKAGEWIAGA